MVVIGVISDTHGLRRPEVHKALAGVDLVIHAGDFDDSETLDWIGTMGKLVGVRGNCDRGAWTKALPEHDLVTLEGHGIFVIHDLARMTLDPKAAGVAVVVYGHTHEPKNDMRDGVLYFNPGSAGPRREGRPVTVGKLQVRREGVVGQVIPLLASARGSG